MSNKTVLSLYIDRDITDLMKLKCKNISKLVENYFRDWLGYNEHKPEIEEKEISEKISIASAQLHELRNKMIVIEKEKEKHKPKIVRELDEVEI